jgi:hypothetical protein
MQPTTQPVAIIYFLKMDAGEIGSERIVIWYALVATRAENVSFNSRIAYSTTVG